MKLILKDGRRYILKFTPGEEVIQTLKEFCVKEDIQAATFQGLGACDYLKLSFFNIETKKYEEKKLNEDLEIANLTGNISESDGKVIVHMHGTFADSELKAIAGHVLEIKISVTCEIFIIKLEGKMERKLDENFGLKLLD